MKAATILAVALSGVAFAAPGIYAADKGEGFKDLTNLKYSNELPVADAAASVERRDSATLASHEADKPVKDNRKLHYNQNNKMPMAMAMPERREADAAAAPASHEADKPVKDNRKLHYNQNNKMPIAMAMPERRDSATLASHEADKPVKDNRKLHYNQNNKMPIAESD